MGQRRRVLSTLAVAGLAVILNGPAMSAPGQDALAGTVASAEEGPMEGVLVTAKRAGSTIAVTVVTDAKGRYRFPRARLEPGDYGLRIKAVGYDLAADARVAVAPGKTALGDLQLVKARDLAAQLSNTEWLMSWPGTEAQKGSARGCAHCHTLERISRSRHDADAFMNVIERMAGYPALSFPRHIQRQPVARPSEAPVDMAARRRLAEYLASVNQSKGPWTYDLKTLPRPKGPGTQVIYTEYDLAAKTRQPHDVIVDSRGMAWWADFGDQILGRLDPKTGAVTEYKIPITKPGAPTGVLAVRFDQDGNIWMANQFQAALVKFDPRTERFETFPLPAEFDHPATQLNLMAVNHLGVDGKVWFQDAGSARVFRLDTKTRKFEVFTPYPNPPRPGIYDVLSDAQNNAYLMVFGGEEVGRIDAKTGKIELWKTPTRDSAPRRGMLDDKGRIWFGENKSDRIGMFDIKTRKFQEWTPPTPGAFPYDVTSDRLGRVWTGGEYDDRILRLDPATGVFVQYLLPNFTNVRRVFVDDRPATPVFWVGNNHEASIVRLESLDPVRTAAR